MFRTTSKFYLCPLTSQVFRHPVKASDGYAYELEALLLHLKSGNKTSPMTGESIDYVTYDLQLKNAIDGLNLGHRYADYDKTAPLQEINSLLALPFSPWRQSLYKSGATAYLMTCLIALDAYIQEKELHSSSLLLTTMLLTSVTDYSIRLVSNHQFGLFGGMRRGMDKFAEGAVLFWDILRSGDPDRDESAFLL